MDFSNSEKEAYNKGYRIDSDGNIFNPLGKEIKKLVYNNYYKFNIRVNGIHKRVKVHRLVAYQKFGDDIYKDNIVVRHLDGNGFNNSFENIDIGTFSQNMMDIPEEERIKKATNASSHTKKYSDEFIEKVKQFHSLEKSYKKTMERFNLPKSTLHNLLHKNL